MMIRKIVTIFIIILLLTGCWNRRELNDIAIAIALSIDEAESEGEYLVTVQIINPGEVASEEKTNRTPVSTYSASAPTIFEALRKLTTVSPRKIYLSHLRVVVISEAVAKEGLKNVLDFLKRDHEVRTNFFVLISKERQAGDILTVLTPMDQIPANKMYTSLTTSTAAFAATSHVTLDEVIGAIVSEGKEVVITGIKIQGDKKVGNSQENVESIESAALLQYEGLAIFKDDKLIGWLNENESKGYSYIIGNVKNTVGHIPCPGDENGKLTIEMLREETDIKVSFKGNKPLVNVGIWAEGSIGEVACKIDLLEEKTINAIEKVANEKVAKIVNATLKKAQEKKADIFGFGEALYRENPKKWNNIKNNWAEEFEALKVNVNVKFNIRRSGTITNSLINQ
jgi:spore germination protein KC